MKEKVNLCNKKITKVSLFGQLSFDQISMRYSEIARYTQRQVEIARDKPRQPETVCYSQRQPDISKDYQRYHEITQDAQRQPEIAKYGPRRPFFCYLISVPNKTCYYSLKLFSFRSCCTSCNFFCFSQWKMTRH